MSMQSLSIKLYQMVLFVTACIGIDVGKKFLQVYLPINDKSFNVSNDQKGF